MDIQRSIFQFNEDVYPNFAGIPACLYTCKILEAEKNAQSGVRRFFQPIPQKNAV